MAQTETTSSISGLTQCRGGGANGDFRFSQVGRLVGHELMKTQPGKAYARSTVTPSQHARRISDGPCLDEATQVGPIAFGRAIMCALVAQRFPRRRNKITSTVRSAESRKTIS